MNEATFYVPLAVATSPASGECICDSWWSVHPEKGLAFYAQFFGYTASEAPSPQCNQSEATSRLLTKRLYPDHEVVKVPAVFVAHAQREMARLKAIARAERDAKSSANIAKGQREAQPTEPKPLDNTQAEGAERSKGGEL